MVCQEKGKLLMHYSDCVGAYDNAVKTLGMHSMTPEMYFQQWDYAEQKRLECEEARLALDRHTDVHKC